MSADADTARCLSTATLPVDVGFGNGTELDNGSGFKTSVGSETSEVEDV